MPLRLPGDYVLKELIITNDKESIDVSSIMLGLEIFEDLYSPGITGHLHIVDAIDLYETLPIVGGERLTVNFSTDLDGTTLPKDFHFKKEFIISGIINIEQGWNNSTKTYTLEFASPIFFKNHEVKLSRLYDANVSEIVNDIYTNALKQTQDFDVEPTKYAEKFVVPNWTPIRTIEHLCRYAQEGTGSDTSYMFFETKDGFTFASLSYLFKKGSTRTLTMKNNWAEGKITQLDPHVITKLDITTTPDLLDGIASGMYGGSLHTVDLINKKYNMSSISYDNKFGMGVENLNTKQLESWPNNQKDFRHHFCSSNAMGANSSSWRLDRMSRMNQINAFTVNVKVPNYTKQKVGDVVTLDIKSARKMDQVQGHEVNDKTLSGKYIIRAIRHVIAQGGYDMVMELAKESI